MKLLPAWLVATIIAISLFLGSTPLADSDEGRNAAVAREMAVTNDYVMPRIAGLPYLDKPIVYFAAAAGMMEILGPTELAARLPAFLFTLATAAVVFWLARRMGIEPYFATILFLAMPLTIAFARLVIFDSALTFFVTVALAAYWVAIEERTSKWSVLAWIAMALAMITKGPVTFVLVLFVVVPFAWRRGAVRLLFPPVGLLAFVLIIAPWIWGVSRVVPEFLEYVLVTETAERMATDTLKRTGPPWYFLPYFLVGALPWSIILVTSWRALKNRDGATLYLLLWLVIPFLFFSLSQSKRPQYIVPLMVPLALLMAKLREELRIRGAAIALVAFGAFLLIGAPFAQKTKLKPEIAVRADDTAILLGIGLLAGGLLALFAKRRELALLALTIPAIVMPVASLPIIESITERRSTRSLIARLQPHLTPRTEIVGLEAFTGSMAFYLGRPILLVTEDGSELTSNYIMRRYERFTHTPGSPLRPMPWLAGALADSTTPRVFIIRERDRKWRTLLESRGLRQIAGSSHFLAYSR